MLKKKRVETNRCYFNSNNVVYLNNERKKKKLLFFHNLLSVLLIADRCGFFPHQAILQHLNYLEVAQTPQFKGSVPQDCPNHAPKCQS